MCHDSWHLCMKGAYKMLPLVPVDLFEALLFKLELLNGLHLLSVTNCLSVTNLSCLTACLNISLPALHLGLSLTTTLTSSYVLPQIHLSCSWSYSWLFSCCWTSHVLLMCCWTWLVSLKKILSSDLRVLVADPDLYLTSARLPTARLPTYCWSWPAFISWHTLLICSASAPSISIQRFQFFRSGLGRPVIYLTRASLCTHSPCHLGDLNNSWLQVLFRSQPF